MAQDAEIILDTDRTEVIGNLTVATDESAEPTVTLAPDTPKISVARSGTISIRNTNGDDVASLSADDSGAGLLTVQDGAATVTAGSDQQERGLIRVLGDWSDWTAVRIGNNDHGGRVLVRSGPKGIKEASKPVVDLRATDSGGAVTVNTRGGIPTGELRGDDASLVLTGVPETGGGKLSGANTRAEYGGGELLVRTYADEIGDRDPAAVPKDNHVHVRAETRSDYGVDAGNRPRVFLDGPSATLELGRGPVDDDREGVAGNLRLRDDQGEMLLEMQTEVNEVDDSVGAVDFYHDEDGTAAFRGRIQAHPRGLMIYDANSEPALLVDRNGELLTNRPIQDTL